MSTLNYSVAAQDFEGHGETVCREVGNQTQDTDAYDPPNNTSPEQSDKAKIEVLERRLLESESQAAELRHQSTQLQENVDYLKRYCRTMTGEVDRLTAMLKESVDARLDSVALIQSLLGQECGSPCHESGSALVHPHPQSATLTDDYAKIVSESSNPSQRRSLCVEPADQGCPTNSSIGTINWTPGSEVKEGDKSVVGHADDRMSDDWSNGMSWQC